MNRATADGLSARTPVEALPVRNPVAKQQTYAERIQARATGHDSRHIEAFMRLEHSTLDHLSEAAFLREVEICAACVDEAGREYAERIAKSMGL